MSQYNVIHTDQTGMDLKYVKVGGKPKVQKPKQEIVSWWVSKNLISEISEIIYACEAILQNKMW